MAPAQSRFAKLLWVNGRRFGRRRVGKNKAEGLARANAFAELTLQFLFGFLRQVHFDRLTARHFRKLRKLVLEIGAADPIPKAVLERKHINVLLLQTDDFGVR